MFNLLLGRNKGKLIRLGKNHKICLNICNRKQLSALCLKGENVEISESLIADHTICNKSGLLKHHRNVLHCKTPYKEPHSWIHLTEKYQRKIYGRYGSESGVSPRICFSAKLDKVKTYEELADKEIIQAMIEKNKLHQTYKTVKIIKREEEINKKLEKLNQWKLDLNIRINKKESDAIATKEKKDRLIEEVRRHFGYKIDPRDERFKEVLEQKEREDKRKQKEVKRKAKEQKLMSKLVDNSGNIRP